MRNFITNLGLLLGSTVILIGLMEFGLRVTGLVTLAPNPPRIYQESSNPEISYELIPSIEKKAYRATVTTNSQGFRSAERDLARPLVVLLGDSITFGYGVENHETLAAQLEKKLPQKQFFNAGVPGYHLGQETAVYRAKVKSLNPSGVILVFHPNDMQIDTGHLDTFGVLQSEHQATDPTACHPATNGILALIPGGCWLDLHSAIYRGVKRYAALQASKRSTAESEELSAAHPEEDSITDAKLAVYSDQFAAFSKELPEGIKKILVLWPDHELHAVSRPKIRALAERYSFTVIDLYDTFGNNAKTLSWDTVHPHPETIERAAQVIAEIIKMPL